MYQVWWKREVHSVTRNTWHSTWHSEHGELLPVLPVELMCCECGVLLSMFPACSSPLLQLLFPRHILQFHLHLWSAGIRGIWDPPPPPRTVAWWLGLCPLSAVVLGQTVEKSCSAALQLLSLRLPIRPKPRQEQQEAPARPHPILVSRVPWHYSSLVQTVQLRQLRQAVTEE